MIAIRGKFSSQSASWMTALAGFFVPTITATAEAGFELGAEILSRPTSHELRWDTRDGHIYELQTSTDLATWHPTGVIVVGDGTRAAHPLCKDAPQRFYRIRETRDSLEGNFLRMPEPATEVDLIDGVCFSFDLDVFPTLPAKIHLYKRPAIADAPWEIIGTIDEFAEVDGIRFPCGSSIWIPDTPGDYQVQAAAIDAAGLVIATATRDVTVGRNQAPTILITGGPPSPSSGPQIPEFTTEVTDHQDAITHVEFYDRGDLIGTDRLAPFGDQIKTPSDRRHALLRGVHEITARAYDARGAVGITQEPYLVEITGGNARPSLELLAPGPGAEVELGQPLTIQYLLTDPDGEADLLLVGVINLGTSVSSISYHPTSGSISIDTTGWEPGCHQLQVIGTDLAGAVSYPRFIDLYVASPDAETSFARELALHITDPLTAPPSNEVFTGVEAAASTFTGGIASGLQIDSGAILTTGLAELWNGGNRYESATESLVPSFNDFRGPGDPLIERFVSGYQTADAASLEFDVFTPNGQLEICYQFGSEEYDAWVNSFNDAFLILINGVVASFVPDCSNIVGVGSVNGVTPVNEHLYLDNNKDILPNVLPENHDTRVEYNGMIRSLKVSAFVTPNRSHRVRLVIADVNDDQLDSALFVNSIRSLPAFR